jgi:hypothetical protein
VNGTAGVFAGDCAAARSSSSNSSTIAASRMSDFATTESHSEPQPSQRTVNDTRDARERMRSTLNVPSALRPLVRPPHCALLRSSLRYAADVRLRIPCMRAVNLALWRSEKPV